MASEIAKVHSRSLKPFTNEEMIKECVVAVADDLFIRRNLLNIHHRPLVKDVKLEAVKVEVESYFS